MGTPPTDIAASKEFSIATCWSSLNQKLHLLSSNIEPKFMMHFKRVKLLQSSLNQELLNNDLHILKFDSGRYPKCQLLMFITKKNKKKQTLPNSPETYSNSNSWKFSRISVQGSSSPNKDLQCPLELLHPSSHVESRCLKKTVDSTNRILKLTTGKNLGINWGWFEKMKGTGIFRRKFGLLRHCKSTQLTPTPPKPCR